MWCVFRRAYPLKHIPLMPKQHPPWRDWLRQTTGATSARQIGLKTGHAHTTIQRWFKHGIPTPEVFAIAIKFNADMCETLITLGWVDESEVARMNVDGALRRVPAFKLTGELHRRAEECRDDVGIPTTHPNKLVHKATITSGTALLDRPRVPQNRADS